MVGTVTASEQAKIYGAKSLGEVSEISGLSMDRLRSLYRVYPNAFKFLIKGIICERGFNKK